MLILGPWPDQSILNKQLISRFNKNLGGGNVTLNNSQLALTKVQILLFFVF